MHLAFVLCQVNRPFGKSRNESIMQTVTSLTEQLRVLRKGGPVTAGRSRKGLNEPTLACACKR